MALSPKVKKALYLANGGLTLGGACCGLSFVPWTGSGPSGPRTLRYRSWYPRFVLGSIEGEENSEIKMPRELFVEANSSLLQKEGQGKEISFDDVTMKFGTKVLKAGDVFFKAGENGTEGYYFAQHIWGSQFRLDNGDKKSWTELTNGSFKPSTGGEEAGKKTTKAINLKFKNGTDGTGQGTSGGGASNKPIFMVGSCKFTLKNQENKPKAWKNIEMRCTSMQGNGTNGGGSENGGNITLEGEHQHYYTYTVTKSS